MGVMDSLAGATTEQKKAALAAMAQAGTKGVEALQSGLSSVGDAQQRAVSSATAGGAWMGGQAQSELAGIAGRSGDAAKMALQRAMSGYQADNAERQASTGAYFDEVGASIPAIKAWSDSQVATKAQEYQQQLAREQEQQNWAREQHAMQMEMLRAQMAKLSASGSDGSSGGLTAAQKAKAAQYAAGDQQRSAAEAALQQQLDAMNHQATLAYRAQQATPNEQAPEQRKYLSANAAEHAAETTTAARQELMPQYDWSGGSLDDMAARFRQAGMDAGGTEAAANSPYAQARLAQAGEQEQARRDALAQLTQMYQQIDQQMRTPQSQLDALSADTQRVKDARSAAMDIYDDPQLALLAGGSYKDPQDLYSDKLKSAELQDQMGYYNQTGFTDPTKLAAAQKAQDFLADSSNPVDTASQTLAKKVGEDPKVVAEARKSGTYQALLQEVAGQPMQTLDDARLYLMNKSAEDPNVTDYIPLVLAELQQRGLLFSSQYAQDNGG